LTITGREVAGRVGHRHTEVFASYGDPAWPRNPFPRSSPKSCPPTWR
jgi:hypothetical protein